MYPVGTLPHTYLMRCHQQTATATIYDFFLDPFVPLSSSPTSLLIIHSEKGPWPGTDRTGCTWHVVRGVQVQVQPPTDLYLIPITLTASASIRKREKKSFLPRLMRLIVPKFRDRREPA
ncbi:uncharacterized protein SEPMUDRAFT_156764 [Sphaerulina musiva SO2202]|uniref:Uncharacterized protein n=1 Tax=Sphaerulina musiva (strain SO2202) TaxID=692275 RepID=N1QHD0_SPHMS|nr:uncharacterized protein SEPMUDRAFT_156764 [Sphaerulina musiva SO2202]EMF11839.1 hypothetical protein SEPMUDRAFT_156764 [Sphaerulina musiva SO2202]